MENAAEALKIGFTILVFITALSVAFAVISQARAASDIVFEHQDDNIYLQEGLEGVTYLTAGTNKKRIVGWDTVVSCIYLYSQGEQYGVTIMDESNNIIARFDLETEAVAQNWYNNDSNIALERDKHIDYLNNKVYGSTYDWNNIFSKIYRSQSKSTSSNKIGAPWLSSDSNSIKRRLDADLGKNIDETVEYITAEYKGLGLASQYSNSKFTESINIITKTEENGDVKEDIEIIYKVQP